MKLRLIRYKDWWQFKIPIYLSIAFTAIFVSDFNLTDHLLKIVQLILVFVLGASYVSVINDYTDKEADKLAKKRNQMTGVSSSKSIILIIGLFLPGIFTGWYIFKNNSWCLFFLVYVLPGIYSL